MFYPGLVFRWVGLDAEDGLNHIYTYGEGTGNIAASNTTGAPEVFQSHMIMSNLQHLH